MEREKDEKRLNGRRNKERQTGSRKCSPHRGRLHVRINRPSAGSWTSFSPTRKSMFRKSMGIGDNGKTHRPYVYENNIYMYINTRALQRKPTSKRTWEPKTKKTIKEVVFSLSLASTLLYAFLPRPYTTLQPTTLRSSQYFILEC